MPDRPHPDDHIPFDAGKYVRENKLEAEIVRLKTLLQGLSADLQNAEKARLKLANMIKELEKQNNDLLSTIKNLKHKANER